VRVGGGDGELRSWHFIYVYSIESRLIMRVRYDRDLYTPRRVCASAARGGSFFFFFFITLKPRVE